MTDVRQRLSGLGGPPGAGSRVVENRHAGNRICSDEQLASNLATEAGRLLLALRHQGGRARDGVDVLGSAAVYTYLSAKLAAVRPGDGVLSVGPGEDPRDPSADRVWIVVPLDGREEFAEGRSAEWAVHVALRDRGSLTTAAMALPARRRTYSSADAPALRSRMPGPLRLAVRGDGCSPRVGALAERLGGELVPMRSTGATTMALLMGDIDAFVDADGESARTWAGPVVLARASGVHASRLDGSPLRFESESQWPADLLVCRPELAVPMTRAWPR